MDFQEAYEKAKNFRATQAQEMTDREVHIMAIGYVRGFTEAKQAAQAGKGYE